MSDYKQTGELKGFTIKDGDKSYSNDVPVYEPVKHDFKAALYDFESSDQSILQEGNYETIKTALRLADRLQSGEVSGEMIFEAKNLRDRIQDEDPSDELRFKAMAEQMIKEESE